MAESLMKIEKLSAGIEDKEILKGVDLEIPKGKVAVVMGPNGSGKSTLSNVIMGHPKYSVSEGSILFEGKNVLEMAPEERSALGIFMSFQYPTSVPGVTVSAMLKAALENHRGKVDFSEFRKELNEAMDKLGIPHNFAQRYVNVGFSGGEKKRLEMLQMMLLKPKLAILDETDSGLDIDALKIVSEVVNSMRSPDRTFIIITHYSRILSLIKPDEIHILVKGKIVAEGGPELADKLEEQGYGWLNEDEETKKSEEEN